jgi:hypothetical protein
VRIRKNKIDNIYISTSISIFIFISISIFLSIDTSISISIAPLARRGRQLQQLLQQLLLKATPLSAMARAYLLLHARPLCARLRCQYLYSCPSKASKLSTPARASGVNICTFVVLLH